MTTPSSTERGILVFSIWAALGFLGLGFLLEGFSQDRYLLSLTGILVLVAAFVAHIVANAIFRQGFTRGETALGIGGFGLLALVFIVGWFGGDMSMSDYYSGITLFGILAAGFLIYLATRYGTRGAFSRFHFHPDGSKEKAP